LDQEILQCGAGEEALITPKSKKIIPEIIPEGLSPNASRQLFGRLAPPHPRLYSPAMTTITREQLIDKALAALAEAAERAAKGPIEHSKALAFVFAFLSTQAGDPEVRRELKNRAPAGTFWTEPEAKVFVDLWHGLARPLENNESADFGRLQTIDNCAGYIFRMFGRMRG
jgi:hypothetical protein